MDQDPTPDPSGETLLRAAFDDAPLGMALVGLDGNLLRVNRALGDMVGRQPASLDGMHLRSLVHPADADSALAPFWVLAEGELGTCQVETRLASWSTSECWALLSVSLVRNGAGRPACVVIHAQDITERRKREERLRHRALHDPLTGLPNRALFRERMERALAGTAARGVAVLLLDLDGFKAVNDGLGHDAGDQVLITVGQRLATCLRAGDVAARVGGDEFALLIERASTPGDAEAVAARVLRALRAPIPLAGGEASVSASVGIAMATYPVHASEFLRAADAALYRAKASGPGTHAVAEAPDPVLVVDPTPLARWSDQLPLAGD